MDSLKTKFRSHLRMLVMHFSLLYAITGAFAASVTVDGLIYEISDGEAKLTGSSSGLAITTLNVPSRIQYDGQTYPVTSIGTRAFKGFYLKEISIGESVTYIGYEAFRNCLKLTKLTLGNAVESIGEGAFRGCLSLTDLFMPHSITTVGVDAFRGCTDLTQLTIPNTVRSFGYRVFMGCTRLNSVTIEDGDTNISIDEDMFDSCPIETVYMGRNINYKSSRSFYDGPFYGMTSLKKLTIGNSVTSIGEHGFSGCTGLTELIIPNSVTSIGENAFSKCTGLKKLSLGNSLTTIDDSAFWGCTGLTTLRLPNSLTTIGNAAFYNCTGLTDVTIPNSVITIGNGTFGSCIGLTDVTIPNSVTTIDNYAFQDCTGITTLTIGSSVTYIGNFAFSGCTGLKNVKFVDSDTEILFGWGDIFLYCPIEAVYLGRNLKEDVFNIESIKSLTIGSSVTGITEYAFSGCKNLMSISCEGIVPPSAEISSFDASIYSSARLGVPEASIEEYRKHEVWGKFGEIVDGVDEIESDKRDASKPDLSLPYEIYSLSGQYMGNNLKNLPSDIYIVWQNGKSFKIYQSKLEFPKF